VADGGWLGIVEATIMMQAIAESGAGGASAVHMNIFGQNQGVQHPLARAWVEAANLMVTHAAALYDSGEACGVEANAAKLLATDAAVEATEAAQITFGGFGYAKEYHVERLVKEALLFRIMPVMPQMLLSFIAGKSLELPASY
jgi:acyl-CoA dehydrogenase